MPYDAPAPLRALIEVSGVLLRRSGSGRILLGRAAGIVHPEALPEALRGVDAALVRARAEASEPIAPKAVERALRDAWGRPPAKLLDDLDAAHPVAVTPLAQVHRGELDGEPVAVKVLRPGLEATVRADLALLEGLRAPLAATFPGLDAGALLAHIRERVLDELDLEYEAAQQRAVARALSRSAPVVVPAAHLDLAAPTANVSAWLEGPTLAAQAPADPAAVARALVGAHVQAARAGLVLTDPRPNHVVLLRDGRVGLLGAGAAVSVDRGRAARQIDLLPALAEAAPTAFASAAHDDLGLLGSREEADGAHALLRDLLAPLVPGGPARLDRAALAATGERGLERLGEAVALAGRMRPEPHDVWLGRGTAQLVAVLAVLEAEEDWAALAAAT